MATHSSVLAWRIPGTGEPRGLPSMGSHRVGHDWSDLAAAVVRSCLKSCMLGFSITWTKNFQMSKLGLEKEEEPEIKLPTFAGSKRKQGNSRKISTSVSATTSTPLTVDHHKLWKALKEMGIQDQLTCLQRNLYAGQEATVRTLHGTTDWFKIVKGVQHGCILSSWLFNLNAEYIMWNSRIDESQGRVKVSGSYINNLRYIVNSLMAESKEELKSLLRKVKDEWKSWLETQHSKN